MLDTEVESLGTPPNHTTQESRSPSLVSDLFDWYEFWGAADQWRDMDNLLAEFSGIIAQTDTSVANTSLCLT